MPQEVISAKLTKQMSLENLRIIVVDAEAGLARRIESLFSHLSAYVRRESNIDRVLERFERESFDVLILSSSALKRQEADGLEVLDIIAVNSPMTQILFLAGAGHIRTAMTALRAGTYHYARLPIGDEELKLLIETALEKRPTYGTNLLLKVSGQEAKFEKLIGRSEPMRVVYEQIRQAAATDIPVLLLGETGTGKDLAAQTIHEQGVRSKGPYVPVSLGSLPTELVASELFGHEKGAFTGAVERRTGKFEQANGGTIFLDEIDAADEKVQVGLLRLIDERKFHRLGGRKRVFADVRIIAATNSVLSEAVERGAFRRDLYYRLNVFQVVMPPLRDRARDIGLLIAEFLRRYNGVFQKNILGIAPQCVSLLEGYAWPGNVRELKNVIQRAALVCSGDVLLAEHLPPRFGRIQPAKEKVAFDVGTPLAEIEKVMIGRALRASGNNRKKAAELLGISRRALYNKLQRYNIAYRP